MSENVYNVPIMLQDILDRKLEDQTPEAKELIQFFTWLAVKDEMPEIMFMAISPFMGMVTKFVEQNYTWNGTRELVLDDESGRE